MTTVSVVLETDSVHASDDISIVDCLEALARQDYPRARIDVIAVDGGKVPGLEGVVRKHFPSATILECPGGTKFEQKNLGMKAARGDIIALLDADCAAASDWISTVERELRAAPPEVAGVQGVTELSPGFLSREVTALLYGMRSGPRDRTAARLVTDNVAFRRDVMRRFASSIQPSALSWTACFSIDSDGRAIESSCASACAWSTAIRGRCRRACRGSSSARGRWATSW